ncbi:MAG: hypothetical protein M3R27_08300 [Bacteroidota bacterium]|nr:hypothetical protein [Bacteroidota bacterium]
MLFVKKLHFSFLLLLPFFFSCKKDKDTEAPDITINTPYENQFYSVFDVINVTASVSDNKQLTEVSVNLLNADQVPAYLTFPINVSSPSASVNFAYALDDIHLEGGMYYLHIFATDGENDAHAYQKIYIAAVPKVLKKLVVTTASSSSQTNVSLVDSTFSALSFYHTFSGDYIGSYASSYYQKIYNCGEYTGHFSGIKLEDHSVSFDISPFISAVPYFTGMYSSEKVNYISRYDEVLKGYDHTGAVVYNAQSMPGYFIKKCILNDNNIIAEEQEKVSGVKKLVAFYPSGVAMQNSSLNQDVVAFCEKNSSSVFVFGNSAGQGKIQLYDRINNNLWDPYPFSLDPGMITSAVKIDEDTYLIGHSNGTIYKYKYTSSSLTPYLTGYNAIQLLYEELSNQVYVVQTGSITSFYYPSATLVNTVSSAETILKMNFLYNR